MRLIISSILALVTNAYDIGCVYPALTPDPWDAREALSNYGVEKFASGTETPMVIRGTHYWGNCQALCLHYHDPRVSDPFDHTKTWGIPIPDFAQNAFSIIMCVAQCDAHFVASLGVDELLEYVTWAESDLHLSLTDPRLATTVKHATMQYYDEDNMNANNLQDLLTHPNVDYDPFILGHVAGFYMMSIADNDGWNSDGKKVFSPESNGEVECTGSCRNYQDTSGYAPVPDPRTYPDLSNDTTKYDCTGLCRRWQPLQEGDLKGSLHRQEHVVPHIGTYARTWLRDVTSDLVDPEYDLYAESLKVIEQLKVTSGDDFRKDMVSYFDAKIKPRVLIRVAMRKEFKYDISFQDYLLFVYGLSMVEYDGVIQAWHEKVIHDIVRPTTYIKHWDTDILETFGGDLNHDGPVNITARDFEALIRVMPHSEFPSGSSCLCTGYQEYTDAYTQHFHNGTILGNFSIADNYYDNMTVVRDMCSQSRLWGGMHFEAAIPAGMQTCSGLGALGVDYIERMKDSSITFNGEEHYREQPRPTCPP